MSDHQHPPGAAEQRAALDEDIAQAQRHLSELEQEHGDQNCQALAACRTRLDQLRAKRQDLGEAQSD